MEKKEVLISIIIPIYNVEDYLTRCLDSICRQTYQNIEIFLVNDGSTDRSAEIASRYCSYDNRFQLITRENGGLSAARNTALPYVKGDYITFIDSDDFVSDEYIAYLYSLIEKTGSDIAICGIARFYDRDQPQKTENMEIQELYTSIQALELLLYRKKIENSACGKLYRKELFQDIKYPEKLYYEDMATTYKLLAKSEKIVLGNKQEYYYFQRSNGIMLSGFNKNKLDAIGITQEIVLYMKKYFPELLPAAKSRQFVSCVQTLRNIPTTKQYAAKRREIVCLIHETRQIVLHDRKNKFTTRLLAAASYVIPCRGIIFAGKFYDWFTLRFKLQKKY